LDRLEQLESVIREDEELQAYWRPVWEQRTGGSLDRAMFSMLEQTRQELDIILRVLRTDPRTAYEEMVIATKATDQATRGSATKTAILALALAWLRREQPAEGLVEAANVLNTDTDSIASMAGALLGATLTQDPPGPVLDHEYIRQDAERLCDIAQGKLVQMFGYPDPLTWRAPDVLMDLVVGSEQNLDLIGLGHIQPFGKIQRDPSTKDAIWHWAHLGFGQTVFVRRREKPVAANDTLFGSGWQAPVEREPTATPTASTRTEETKQGDMFSETAVTSHPQRSDQLESQTGGQAQWLQKPTLDDAFEEILKSNFDPDLVGNYLLSFSTRPIDGHALAMAFAAMVAKAWRSRVGRRGAQ
jgi:hypothetical protein